MDTELVKEIGNLSLGVIAVVGLIFVVVQQLGVIKSLGELINKNTLSTDEGTKATQELKNVISQLCEKLNNKSDAA